MLNEQRTSPRKVLKTRALVAFAGDQPLIARTVDVGANGICLSYQSPIQPGRVCELSFDLFIDGKASTISTRSKASYCILSGGEYKIGFQFVNLDLAAMSLLAKFLR
ncbi:MAG: PilZ protein [Massilia sp.]|nr:PilZ protein [Massilia sp.]MDB5950145.1 PilZ protein [Massilia sp.]